MMVISAPIPPKLSPMRSIYIINPYIISHGDLSQPCLFRVFYCYQQRSLQSLLSFKCVVNRHFQVSHETIDWVEVRPPAGPLKDTQSFSKPLLSCLDCAFRVIVKGESECSAQSEILSGLYQVFKDFAPFRFPSTPTSLAVPAAEEQPPPPQHDAAIATHQGFYCEGEEWCLVLYFKILPAGNT